MFTAGSVKMGLVIGDTCPARAHCIEQASHDNNCREGNAKNGGWLQAEDEEVVVFY